MAVKNNGKKIRYVDSGVDILSGEETVERIKELAKSTCNGQVLTSIGAFGGLYKLDLKGVESPVLVSSCDGVGTKLKLAFMTGIHGTVGEDLVNHCVNDILVQGAKGLFFLDYIACGTVRPETVAEVVSGVARGCLNHRIALIGGETAEMPEFYRPDEYDLAGTIVGIVDEKKAVTGAAIGAGDICLGLASNGLHTNGYTLARKVIFEIARLTPEDYVADLGTTVAEELLKVHRSYAPAILPLLSDFDVHGMAHITGSGSLKNLSRILPSNVDAVINKSSWPVLPIFRYLEDVGNIDPEGMYEAFNMGIGFILVVAEQDVLEVKRNLESAGEQVYEIGVIQKGNKSVKFGG